MGNYNLNDNVYLLEDDTLIHLEFQTTKKKEDIYRFMVSDAVLAYKERKPVRTIVIYSADIVNAASYLDIGSITDTVDTFYMIAFDGDVIYNELVGTVNHHEKLSKQDLMSIVLLSIMKSKDDKLTRIKNCIDLSKKIGDTTELMQVQAMLYLMAEKFVSKTDLEIVKEMISFKESVEKIIAYTGLDEATMKELQEESL